MGDHILIICLFAVTLLNAVAIICILLQKMPCCKNKGLLLLNLSVAQIMDLFLLFRAIEYAQGFNSAPAWVVLIESVYFLVPLGVVDFIYFAVRKIRHS
jgi:hypothetical protein